jgi:predicted Rossmann fold flavoprotein
VRTRGPSEAPLTLPRAVCDVLVVGAGAAGLATAIFAARSAPALKVVCVDGARTIGAKILVSGGSRCNVTNREVTERDFSGGSARVIRRVLRAFPADRAARFFEDLGVSLHEEELGKLFPDSQRSRTVLEALLSEAARLGVEIRTNARVVTLVREQARAGSSDGVFVATLATGQVIEARQVVLATGGTALPKTGSDGGGYALARALGHGFVDTTPALAPLVLDGDRHLALVGRAFPVALTLRAQGQPAVSVSGSLLWTHFGISGPAALDLSRHWHRASLERRAPTVSVSVCPGETFESLEAWFKEIEVARGRARVATVLSQRLPAAVADLWLADAGIAEDATLAHLSREQRRALVSRLIETPLRVRDSRGYTYAEATAGGVPLDEIDAGTMVSRVCPGLYLVGEILDVDGRLGGFNFQWAWSSAWVAGQGIAKASVLPAAAPPAGEPFVWLTTHRDLLPAGGLALDLACGRGRNALWLAEHGFHVRAVDRNADALRELTEEARRRGVSAQIAVEQVDLESGPPNLPEATFDVIVVSNYLHRPLFPSMLAALRPGGVLVYETFTTAQAARGKPTNPDFLLRPGELRERVASLEMLAEREGVFDGRDVASLVARRRQDP